MKETISIISIILGVFLMVGTLFLLGPLLGGQQITTSIALGIIATLVVGFTAFAAGTYLVRS